MKISSSGIDLENGVVLNGSNIQSNTIESKDSVNIDTNNGGNIVLEPSDNSSSSTITLKVPNGSNNKTLATDAEVSSQLVLKAPLASPAFTGTPTAPTQTAGDNSTKIATTQYVDGKMVLMTAQNSTSGTSIDFTGIPSWAKKITVMFNGVSTNGSSPVQIQLGDSGGIENSGYLGSGSSISSTVATSNYTSGFVQGQYTQMSAFTRQGLIQIIKVIDNTWICYGMLGQSDSAQNLIGGGSKTLSGTLDRVRITTINGTDTFDAGSINIMYEG